MQEGPHLWDCKPLQRLIDFSMGSNAIVLINGCNVSIKLPSGHVCLGPQFTAAISLNSYERKFIFAMGDILQRLITGPAPKTKWLAVAQTLITTSTPTAQEILQKRCRKELKKWIEFYVAISFKLKWPWWQKAWWHLGSKETHKSFEVPESSKIHKSLP